MLNDSMRNVAVEAQPSHIGQKLENLLEKQKERMEQWEIQSWRD